MEHRWNHDIPTQYFTDPQYNAGYAPSRMRHDSGNSTSSSRCSNSLYSSYPSRSYTEASPPDLDPIRYSNEADSYYSPFYSSPLSNSPYRSTSPTRHNPIPALYTSPLTPPSLTQNLNRERHYCEHSSCVDRHGQRTSFSRRADLNRHAQSVHSSVLFDCPWPRCERKGERGFVRMDHLIEHRRGYHDEAIPKREGER